MSTNRGRKPRNPNFDPDVAADANDELCPYCGASYQDFRGSISDAGAHTSALIAAAGARSFDVDAAARDRDSHTRQNVTISTALRDMGRIKRSEWNAVHGPALCVDATDYPDELAAELGRSIARARGWREFSAAERASNLDELCDELQLEADDAGDASFDPTSWDAPAAAPVDPLQLERDFAALIAWSTPAPRPTVIVSRSYVRRGPVIITGRAAA